MKLKKAEMPEAEPVAAVAPSGAVIADRFKLDVDTPAQGPAGVNKTAAMIAAVAALAAAAMIGAAAALMYVNWGLIAGA